MTEDTPNNDPFQELGQSNEQPTEKNHDWTAKRPDPFAESAENGQEHYEQGFDDGISASHTILNLVAHLEDCDVEDLPPLGKTIDPDELNKVVANDAVEQIKMWYAGYEIQVSKDDIKLSDGVVNKSTNPFQNN